MNEGTRFLIFSLAGEDYGIAITRVLEITAPRQLQKDPNLTEMFEGKFEYRGRLIPVLNIKKVFQLSGSPGTTLLIIKGGKGMLGILVDAVTEILDSDQKPLPLPKGVVNPTLRYYGGIIRHREKLVLLLNEDGLMP
jgi:chemotaxis signal transduction protein